MSNPDPQQDDEELARRLQQEEIRSSRAPEPVRTAYVGYTAVANYEEPGTVPVYGTAVVGGPALVFGAHEQRLMDTYALGRGIRVLAVLDAIILLINMIFNPFFLLVIWGPVCGYLAGTRYQLQFAYAYVGYYLLRIAGDIALCALGAWWFVIALIIDLIILRYVLLFCTMLKKCSGADIEQLTQPESIWTRSRNYFVVF
jgi:hypothetical protein